MLGGTFDPIHIGHLLIADEVLARLGYEQIRFVPAYTPPHKRSSLTTDDRHRLEMVRLAVDDRREFVVDTFELDERGVSYTVSTLRHLVDDPSVDGRPGLIIGEDLVAGFDRWYRVEEIVELADLILVRRPGGSGVEFPRAHTLIGNLPLDVSSTEIRDRVRDGLPYRYLVTPVVFEYIRRNGLYERESRV